MQVKPISLIKHKSYIIIAERLCKLCLIIKIKKLKKLKK